MYLSNESNMFWPIGRHITLDNYIIGWSILKWIVSYQCQPLFYNHNEWQSKQIDLFVCLFFRAGVGTNGSMQTLYYCEVTDSDKATSGGGIDDEIIDVVELTMDECKQMCKQGAENNAPPSCLLGILWFLTNKASQWLCHVHIRSMGQWLNDTMSAQLYFLSE